MNPYIIYKFFTTLLRQNKIAETDPFYDRLLTAANDIHTLYSELYGQHSMAEEHFAELVQTVMNAYINRPQPLKEKDAAKPPHWFISNELTGMSLYVDRFCGNLKNLADKLDYFEKLGVNLLHLMPIFESPPNESDGGYAVSDFRKIDSRFGTLEDLEKVQETMRQKGQYLMLDIVLNHTSHHHEWAKKAKAGSPHYQDFFTCMMAGKYQMLLRPVCRRFSPGRLPAILPGCPNAKNGQ